MGVPSEFASVTLLILPPTKKCGMVITPWEKLSFRLRGVLLQSWVCCRENYSDGMTWRVDTFQGEWIVTHTSDKLIIIRTQRPTKNSPEKPLDKISLKREQNALTVAQVSKNFPAFCGTRRFITVSTRAHHRYLPWTWWIHSRASNHFWIHFNIILPSRSPK